MSKSIKAIIKPEILQWARMQAGYSVEDIARKVSVKIQQVINWENGSDMPTITQLKTIANKLGFPLSVFYLDTIPKDFRVLRIKDFRQLPNSSKNIFSPHLIYVIHSAEQRRELALEMVRNNDEEIPQFSLKASLRDNPELLGQTIRSLLGISHEEQQLWKDSRIAFNRWREAIENIGVLVFQTGVIPKWKNFVSIDEMRGFALAEEILPVIVINRKDHYHGRIFSLIHELTHIILGESGISSSLNQGYTNSKTMEQQVEVFCNKVAAATLLPEKDFMEDFKNKSGSGTHKPVLYEDIASRYNVSSEVVLIRSLTLKLIDQQTYHQVQKGFRDKLSTPQPQPRSQSNQRGMRINIPNHTFSELGKPYVQLVLNTYYNNDLTLSEVSDYLGGINLKHLSNIEQEAV